MNVKKYVAALSVAAVVSITPLATTPVWADNHTSEPCVPSAVTTSVVVTPAVPGTPGTPAVPATPGTPAIPATEGTPAVPPVTETIPAVAGVHYVHAHRESDPLGNDEVPPTPMEDPSVWQANTAQEPPGHFGHMMQPDGTTYEEGEAGLHYASNGSSGRRDWFFYQPAQPEQVIVITPGIPAVAGAPAVPAVPGTPGTPAVPGTPEIPASTQTVVVPAVECENPDTPTNEVLGVEAAAGNNNGNGNNNNGNNNNGNNNNGGVEVQGQQATAPAQAPAPAVAAQQQAVPTSINAGLAGETASNQLLLPAGLAMLGALLGMVAFAARRRA